MERSIVVVGKAGQGKSATIASVKRLGEINCNEPLTDENISDENPLKETKIVIYGHTYCFVDTPSFFDFDWYIEKSKLSKDPYKIVDPEEPHMKVLEQIQKIFASLNGQKSVVLFIIKGTERFTRESKESISVMKRYFGDALIDRTIFVLTNADQSGEGNFAKVHDVIRAHLTAIGYSAEINDRFVDFDNKSNPKAQIDLLLEKIEALVSSCDPYSMKDFNNALNALKEEKQKLQQEKELEIQKREIEEKLKVEELYSRDVQKLKEKLNEKQLELDTLVEMKSNQSGLTSEDVSSKNITIENVPEHQEKKLLMNKAESFGKDPQETYRYKGEKNPTRVEAGSTSADFPSEFSAFKPAAFYDNEKSTEVKVESFDYPPAPKSTPVQPDYSSSIVTNPKQNYSAEISHLDNRAPLSSESHHAGAISKSSKKSYNSDYGSNYRLPMNVNTIQRMEDALHARGIMIKETNKQIKILSEDIKRLSDQPPKVVHYEEEPEEKPSWLEKVGNMFTPKRKKDHD